MTNLPTIERLREVFHLQESGALIWRDRRMSEFSSLRACQSWNGRYAGKPAGHLQDGYVVVSVDGRDYRAHRIVWAMRNSQWPEGDVDHENHKRSDNDRSNMRDVSRGENTRNASRRRDNTSGVTGVRFYAPLNKWQVSAGSGKGRHVGYFDTFEDALNARQLAAAARGFHPNHGTA